MTVTLDPGTTLAATEALRTRRGHGWSDEQVAYLIALAYASGLTAGHVHGVAELLATWAEHPTLAQPTREDRIAAEIAAAGPVRYHGGPVDWETGRPAREVQ